MKKSLKQFTAPFLTAACLHAAIIATLLLTPAPPVQAQSSAPLPPQINSSYERTRFFSVTNANTGNAIPVTGIVIPPNTYTNLWTTNNVGQFIQLTKGRGLALFPVILTGTNGGGGGNVTFYYDLSPDGTNVTGLTNSILNHAFAQAVNIQPATNGVVTGYTNFPALVNNSLDNAQFLVPAGITNGLTNQIIVTNILQSIFP